MLVDDHLSVLWGLERLIQGEHPRMEIVAQASSCARALELAKQASPDVIVLDLDLAGENGVDIIPQLVLDRSVRVLVLTGMRDRKIHEQSILNGASGLVYKEQPPETILKAIEKVHEGELWLDRTTTGRIFVELSRPKEASPDKRKLASLTARELTIVKTLATDPGPDNRELAERLHMGEHTLRNHLSRIYDKLGVKNRLELYLYAQQHLSALSV
jgi:two-component system, NarL family, nitrate/nitrite response regulator NarL